MRQPIHAEIGDHRARRELGPITQTDVVRFAGAGGDFNPLHHDPDFVQSTGFRGVISMGQMQAGYLAGWLSDWVGVEHLRELEVRFAAPVFLGDVLSVSGEVVSIETTDGTAIAQFSLQVTRGDEVVVKAKAKAAIST